VKTAQYKVLSCRGLRSAPLKVLNNDEEKRGAIQVLQKIRGGGIMDCLPLPEELCKTIIHTL
jgi:hypothetical protein